MGGRWLAASSLGSEFSCFLTAILVIGAHAINCGTAMWSLVNPFRLAVVKPNSIILGFNRALNLPIKVLAWRSFIHQNAKTEPNYFTYPCFRYKYSYSYLIQDQTKKSILHYPEKFSMRYYLMDRWYPRYPNQSVGRRIPVLALFWFNYILLSAIEKSTGSRYRLTRQNPNRSQGPRPPPGPAKNRDFDFYLGLLCIW